MFWVNKAVMYKKAFLISLFLGIVWGFAAVYIAIEHNTQMAVYDTETGVYDIKYLSRLFISWFALITFGFFTIFSLFILVRKKLFNYD